VDTLIKTVFNQTRRTLRQQYFNKETAQLTNEVAGSDERVLLPACRGWLDPSILTFWYIRKCSDRASNCHEMKLQATCVV